MKKYLIPIVILMLVVVVILLYIFVRPNKVGNETESGPRIVVDISTFDYETNNNTKSQKIFPAQIGTVLPIGEETKIVEAKDNYILLSIKPATRPRSVESGFGTDYCLNGVENVEVRLIENKQLILSSCTLDAGTNYVVKYLKN